MTSRPAGRAARRGITLIEVLIAIGVMSVGLLGLASLLPVARFFMADGSKYDHTSVVGHKALRELEIRKDLMTPTNWYSPDGLGTCTWVCPPNGNGGVLGMASYNYLFYTQTAATTDIPAAPWVLDPLGCAYPDNLVANNGNYLIGPTFFPPGNYSLDTFAGLQAAPALSRVTIPRDNQMGVGFYQDGVFSPVANPAYAGDATVQPPLFFRSAPMPFGQAQKIFQSSDDLVFQRPDDEALRPFVAPPPATDPWRYTTSQGDYSWFAVIDNVQKPWNPGSDGGWGNAGLDDNSDGIVDNESEAGWPLNAGGTFPPASDDIALWQTSGGEAWHVWVVVVHKRNLKLQAGSPGDIPPERMCYCDFLTAPVPPPAATSANVISNAGMGGGDCLLSISASQFPSPDWLNVKVNQWIMLSAFPNLSTSLTTPIKGTLCTVQWFRISAVGDIVAIPGGGGAPSGWQRNVTLVGGDWNPYTFYDALGVPPTTGFSGVNFQTAYATIVDGVTGVFEATIEQGQ